MRVHGVTNLGGLKTALQTPVSSAEIASIRGISNKKISSQRDGLASLYPGSPPPDIDHLRAPNSYLSRYPNPLPNERGKLEWEEMDSKTVTYKAFVSINDMIDRIFLESEKVFKGIKHENDWAIYHDVLSFSTAIKSK